jgi:hypothetical protein
MTGAETGARGCQARLARLIVATSVPATTATGVAAATPGAISAAAARFLRTRLVHLKLPAIHIEAVEFTDGLGCIASIAQFDKSEAARAPGFPVGDDSSR